jgi:hypothetical protein
MKVNIKTIKKMPTFAHGGRKSEIGGQKSEVGSQKFQLFPTSDI